VATYSHLPPFAHCRDDLAGTVAAARATLCWSADAAKKTAASIKDLKREGLTVSVKNHGDKWLVLVEGRMQLEAAQAVRAAVVASGQDAVAYHQHRAGVTGGTTPTTPGAAIAGRPRPLPRTLTLLDLPVAASTSQGPSQQPGPRCAGLPMPQRVWLPTSTAFGSSTSLRPSSPLRTGG